MPYTLYNRLGSAGLAVEATLTLADIAFDLVEIDSAAGTPSPDSFRAVNPWGQFPTLILENGDTLTESAAILTWLATTHTSPATGPSPDTAGYAKFLRWIVFGAVNVHEASSHMSYPERFTTDSDGHGAVVAAAQIRMRASLEAIDTAFEPGPFLLGEELCSADIYLAMLLTWYRAPLDAPRLKAVAERVSQHPVIAPIWDRHINRDKQD